MKNALRLIIIILMLSLPAVITSGDDIADPFAKGVKLFNQGSYEKAIPMLSAGVNVLPDDPVRRLTLGVALANARRYDEAIAEFQAVTKLLPGDPVAYLLLDGAYLAKGAPGVWKKEDGKALEVESSYDDKLSQSAEGADMDSVVTAPSSKGEATSTTRVENLLLQQPDNAIAQNLLGDLSQVRGDYSKAITHYRKAAELAPNWIKPWFNLGMANLEVNPAEAAADFNRVVELDPKNLQAQLWLGDAYTEQNNYPLALQAYKNAANSKDLESAARSRIGNVYLKQNQPQRAEQEFRAAAEQAPHDPVAAAGLGDALQQQQRLEEGAKEYKRASELTQANPAQQLVVVPSLANIYIEKGDYSKAIDELKRIVSLNPRTEIIMSMVDACHRGGLLLQGIKESETTLAKEPQNTVAIRFLAAAYSYSGNQEGRAQMAKKLLKLIPSESPVWYRELGCAEAALGEGEAALDAWRKGLEYDPLFDTANILRAVQSACVIGDLKAYYQKESTLMKGATPSLILATIYEQLGDFSKAAEVRSKLTQLYPEKQHYWILLGDDLLQSGDTAKAKAAYTKAAIMDDTILKSIAQERMKSLK